MATEAKQVEFEGRSFSVIREGAADILNPILVEDDNKKDAKGKKSHDAEMQSVFYNPIQQYNRDLTVLAIRVFVEDLNTICQQQHGKRRFNPSKPNKKRKRDDDNDTETLEQGQPPLKIVKSSANGEPTVLENSAGGLNDTEAAPTNEVNLDSKNAQTDSAESASKVIDKLSGNETQSGVEEPSNSDQAQEPATGPIPSGPKAAAPTKKTNFEPRIRILDALSATGLRALRYGKEMSSVTSVTANDLSPLATQAIAVNARYNKISSKIEITTGDANNHMQRHRGCYEVVDLDPYGTAAPFLDAAVQALTDGGLLCVTCTDSGVFASVGHLEKTFSQYGGLPAKGPYSHEAGLRLVLHTLATSAARYGLAIEPLLSLSIDFYVRVFVKVRRSPQEVKLLASKTMIVYNCDSGCGAWTKQYMARTRNNLDKKGNVLLNFSLAQAPTTGPNCKHCGFKTHLAGPMWGGPIHNPFFIQRMLDVLPSLSDETYGTKERLKGMLTTARDEILLPLPTTLAQNGPNHNSTPASPYPLPRVPPQEVDHFPFFVLPSVLSGVLRCNSPPTNALRGALLGLGYRVTISHCKPGSIRTDAPWSVIWEIMREWIRQKSPVKEGAIRPGTAGWGIMRSDRSKAKLNEVKAELREISSGTNEVSEIKTKLQSLLWRLDNQNGDKSDAQTQWKKSLRQHVNRDAGSEEAGSEDGNGLHTSELNVDFDEARGRESDDKRRLVRYQLNPRANWGPITRAKG